MLNFVQVAMLGPRENRSCNLRIRVCCILLLQFLAFGALNELSAQTIEELSSQAAAARDVKDFPREKIKRCLLRLYHLRQQDGPVVPDFNRLPF